MSSLPPTLEIKQADRAKPRAHQNGLGSLESIGVVAETVSYRQSGAKPNQLRLTSAQGGIPMPQRERPSQGSGLKRLGREQSFGL